MTAAFGNSLTVIDLDGDGIHDRLYAGDRIGRLWRFDLDAAAPAQHWASGAVFANLGTPGIARGFIAAPDVALVTNANNESWLSIAMGTATMGTGAPSNRFYVLRDSAVFEQWSSERYRRLILWSNRPAGRQHASRRTLPLRLLHSTRVSQVLARRHDDCRLIYFTVAETSARLVSSCDGNIPSQPATLSVTSSARKMGHHAGPQCRWSARSQRSSGIPAPRAAIRFRSGAAPVCGRRTHAASLLDCRNPHQRLQSRYVAASYLLAARGC